MKMLIIILNDARSILGILWNTADLAGKIAELFVHRLILSENRGR